MDSSALYRKRKTKWGGNEHVAITSELLESSRVELKGDECDVRVVHRLEFLSSGRTYEEEGSDPLNDPTTGTTHDTLVRALKVGIRDQLLDGCRRTREDQPFNLSRVDASYSPSNTYSDSGRNQ